MTALIVAIIAAKDRADSVGDTVRAVLPLVDRVLVVDDGSRDGTAGAAAEAGAGVLVLPHNVGKGAAVTAGVRAVPDAAVYLLVDADTGASAAAAEALLGPVLDGSADMTVGVLPAAGRSGGFGAVRRLSAGGIHRATGEQTRAPLSGQRAVRGELLRRLLPLAPRFGLETALTIDAVRTGARVAEVDVDMTHRATGRSAAGFRHRAGQGTDVVRALWPRLTTARQRIALMLVALVVASVAALWMGGRSVPASVAAGRTWSKVVVFDMPGLQWSDVGTGRLPNYDRLLDHGAVAATSVRTLGTHPTVTEGWATFGAGARVAASDQSALAFDTSDQFEGGPASAAAARRTGRQPQGDVVVVGAAATAELNAHKHLASDPGALGDALHRGGRRTAAVGSADRGVDQPGSTAISRPAPLGVMDRFGSVDAGQVSRLLTADPSAPFGQRADPSSVLAAFDRAQASADVIAVDSGDLQRAIEYARVSSPAQAAAMRDAALRSTDDLLGQVAGHLAPDTLLLVVSVAPPGPTWELQPTLAFGPGVPHGELHSPSVRRAGVVTITDLGPTVLSALGLPADGGMIGHALRFRPGTPDLQALSHTNRDAGFRESWWFRVTVAFIIFQSAVYVLAAAYMGRPGGGPLGRFRRPLVVTVLAVTAFPVASFLYRGIPNVAALGLPGLTLMLLIDLAIVALALRARRHPLSPLSWILGATVALLVADIATGARLQTSSLLGYSLHTAARFTGIGNSAFAALAVATVLVAAIHVHWAPRRREALVAVACLFAFVVLIDGAPSLGDDVGGILTLVPVFGIALLVLAGRRVRWRTILAAAAATAGVLVVATGVDLLRPPDARTHLGRFVSDLLNGRSSELATTVSRKLASNLRTYNSVWCWIVVIITFYLVYALVFRRTWTRTLPAESALRVGVVAALVIGVLGNLLNDSGVVVTALVFVYIGPFITMLAVADQEPAPITLEPAPAAAPAGRPTEVAGRP